MTILGIRELVSCEVFAACEVLQRWVGGHGCRFSYAALVVVCL